MVLFWQQLEGNWKATAVFWQQLDAANWMLPMMSLPCHLLCFGNNRMLPMHMSLLWQQPNAANDVL